MFRKHSFVDIVNINLLYVFKLIGCKCNTKINYFTKIQIIRLIPIYNTNDKHDGFSTFNVDQ